jgi:phage terminase large subunit-like protein
VAEINYGGAMVEATINALGKKDLNVKQLTASRGKSVRAEPISALYARGDGGKVHHVGRFPELEQQMCDFTVSGYEGPLSPDRADALVWLLTELFPGIVRARENPWERGQHETPRVITQPRCASAYTRRSR